MNRKQRRAMGKDSSDIFNDLFQQALQHHIAGRLVDAEAGYRHIITLEPNHADSLHMMGVMATDLGHPAIGEDFIRKAIAVEGLAFTLYNSLGNALKDQNRTDEAIAAYQQALVFKRDYADALNNLGLAHMVLQRTDEAVTFYKRALSADPKHIGTLNNIGLALEAQKNPGLAEEYYRRALAIDSNIAEVHYNLANTLNARKLADEAKQHYLKAASLKPYPQAYTNLGVMLHRAEQYEEALLYHHNALELQPRSFETLNNLGLTHHALRHYEKAVEYYQDALRINADSIEIMSNLARSLFPYGRLEETIFYLKRCLELDPYNEIIYNDLLLIMLYASSVSPTELADTARAFGQNIADPCLRLRPLVRNMDPTRRLKIGYVSADFKRHSARYFIEPLLHGHDHTQFEIFAYSAVQKPDAETEHLKQMVDNWHDIYALTNDEACDLIESHNIDILIDLSGHTDGNRLMVFARKPAPIQASWMGFPATTGMKAMDYRITNTYAEPVGMTEHLNVETLWRLPDTFWCYLGHPDSPSVIDRPPSDDNGYITFGCFNNFSKVTDPVLTTWARIMAKVSDSRLLLEIGGLDGPQFRADTEDRMRRLGLPMDRVILEPRRSANQFVLYNKLDIALDPFPCNGGTTSMDTLWMGVPFVTLVGNHFISRFGLSLLRNIGLEKLAAYTEDEYVALACNLAQDRDLLRQTRHNLRKKVAASPLMDEPHFVCNMESAYRGMWETYIKTALDPE